VAQFDPTSSRSAGLRGTRSIRIKPGSILFGKTIESVNMPKNIDGEYYSPVNDISIGALYKTGNVPPGYVAD